MVPNRLHGRMPRLDAPSRTPLTRTHSKPRTVWRMSFHFHLCTTHYLEWKQLQLPRFQPMDTKSFSTFMKMHMLAFKVPQVSQILIHILAIGFGSGFVLFSINSLSSPVKLDSGIQCSTFTETLRKPALDDLRMHMIPD